MRLFVRVIDRRSFTAAAADLGLPRSTATEAMRRLESDLGSRLLERTTRHVAPTPDGEAYYQRCLSILADIDEAENALRGGVPAGVLRIDAHGVLTRSFLLPRLPEFLDAFPQIVLHIGQGDRLVDMVREGVDCVIRAGEPDDSGMIMRKLPSIPEMTCASPEYLKRNGVPATPDDLEGHQMVGFVSSRTGRVMPLEFETAEGVREITLPCRLTANEAETNHHLARMGYGIIQAPRYRFREDIERGILVEVLPDYPPPLLPLAAFYPQNRQLSPRVRVFLDWVVGVFEKAKL
ncbi:LysR family transcriptional regulator [Brucella endophytica]|uniref:LysR family transcriptional regulator n=2 Tax=Brucella endophytica TaxID=1963359 RepID=A0A916WB23_9HYPH|nr:LysR family transcriptional regulator [Brucella endophytica]